MTKKKKILLAFIIILILLALGIGVYYFFFWKSDETSEVPVPEVKVTNQIDQYGYHLDDRDTELFKEKFESLKELLEQESFDETEYANLVSQLFIIDLYTIDNKISKYDIGGLEYVYEPAKESFQSVVMDTIYKTVINNIDQERSQSLPEVKTISVNNITPGTYTLPDEEEVDSYDVDLSWTYVTDYGYDTYGRVTLIKNNDRLDVVLFDPQV